MKKIELLKDSFGKSYISVDGKKLDVQWIFDPFGLKQKWHDPKLFDVLVSSINNMKQLSFLTHEERERVIYLIKKDITLRYFKSNL